MIREAEGEEEYEAFMRAACDTGEGNMSCRHRAMVQRHFAEYGLPEDRGKQGRRALVADFFQPAYVPATDGIPF